MLYIDQDSTIIYSSARATTRVSRIKQTKDLTSETSAMIVVGIGVGRQWQYHSYSLNNVRLVLQTICQSNV